MNGPSVTRKRLLCYTNVGGKNGYRRKQVIQVCNAASLYEAVFRHNGRSIPLHPAMMLDDLRRGRRSNIIS